MPLSVKDIITYHEQLPHVVERVGARATTPSVAIVEYRPEWPQQYAEVEQRVRKALGSIVVDIVHTGSTSIPGLPAKNIIDVDLTVKDILDEQSYVKPLEEAGFLFLLREPQWHQHRLFTENWPNAFHVNLHIWGPDSPEVVRHRIFHDWLLKSPEDRQIYAKVKREAAEATTVAGDTIEEYNQRKEKVLHEILQRAFRDLGYVA